MVDPTVQVAFLGIFTSLVTTAGIVIVAMVNNRKERETAAESAVEKTLRERIILRDEQLSELKEDVQERDREIMRLNTELASYREAST